MIEFRDALTDLLDEFGTDDHGESDGTYCFICCYFKLKYSLLNSKLDE